MTGVSGASLVLGSEGLVGGFLCDYLRRQGREVRCLDIRRSGAEDLRYCTIDLKGVSEVYFLAWDVGGARYLYRPDTQAAQLAWNAQLLANTVPQLAAASVPWLFASSQLAGRRDAYGLLKSLGEYWCEQAGGTCVRLWNVYGGYEPESERRHLLGDCVDAALRTGEIHLLTTGAEQRRFLYGQDAARGLVAAMALYSGNIYDICGIAAQSVLSAAEQVAALTGARVYPGTAWARMSVAQYDEPRSLPRFQPQIPLEAGLGRMIGRYKLMLGIQEARDEQAEERG